MPPETGKPKRKQPSGAQNRKARAARLASAGPMDRVATLGWGGTYLSTDAYKGVSKDWDPNSPPVELPIYGQPPTTLVSQVAATLVQLEQGAFYAPAYLWDGMLRDDRLTATINVRLSGLFGQRLDLLPADDSDEADEIKELTEKRIAKMLPNHQLMHLMRYALGLSVGIAQVLTERTEKSTKPTIRVWNPRHLRYDWLLRKYRLVTANRGEITLDPEDPEWIIYEPFGPLGWIHGALMRSLVQPWLIRYWTRTWWSRYQEVHGHPLRAGIMPVQRDPKDERTFLNQLKNLAHEAVVRLPQGADGNRYDLKLIEAESNNWRGFLELLKHCDDAIATVLLGQRQSTEGQGGLGTQEKAGESTLVRILRGDALVADILREQFLMPWAQDNFGSRELAPYLKWNVEPPEDLSEKAKALLALSQSAVQLAAAPAYGKHVDVRALLEMHDVPLVPEDQVPPDVPGTPAPLPEDMEPEPEPTPDPGQAEQDKEDKAAE